MHVSTYAIREGIILDLAGLLEHHDIRNDTVNRMMQQYHVDTDQVRRVGSLAGNLITQVKDDFGQHYQRARQLLLWAVDLHEIGLSVSHASHNKHSAYLLQNSVMHGFSRQEQKQLGFLVLNHRRRLRPMSKTYGFSPDWRLVQILRLACLFGRRRDDAAIPPDIGFKFKGDALYVRLSPAWLEEHPLTAESLVTEQVYQQEQGLTLKLDLE